MLLAGVLSAVHVHDSTSVGSAREPAANSYGDRNRHLVIPGFFPSGYGPLVLFHCCQIGKPRKFMSV